MEIIVGQLISLAAAQSIFSQMKKTLGPVTPENLSSYSVAQLRAAGLTQRKAEYIRDIAVAIVDGSLDFDDIHTMDNETAVKELMKIRGVGGWTEEMLLMGPFGRMDIVSYQDVAILRAMSQLYHWKEPTRKDFQQIANLYSPYGTVASIYLWHLSYNL